MDSFIQDLLMALIIFILFLLICREIVCWYFKINKTVLLLEEIRDSLKGPETKESKRKTKPIKEEGFSFTD